MLIRLVKMEFQEDKTQDFLSIFEKIQDKIRGFDGCTHLALLRDQEKAHVFFTYSHWKSKEALEKYRDSAFFVGVWKETKALFKEKAQAWSVEQVEI